MNTSLETGLIGTGKDTQHAPLPVRKLFHRVLTLTKGRLVTWRTTLGTLLLTFTGGDTVPIAISSLIWRKRSGLLVMCIRCSNGASCERQLLGPAYTISVDTSWPLVRVRIAVGSLMSSTWISIRLTRIHLGVIYPSGIIITLSLRCSAFTSPYVPTFCPQTFTFLVNFTVY